MIEGVEPYLAYQESGLRWLGAMPQHWHLQRMKSVFVQRNERGFPQEPLLACTQAMGVVRKDRYGVRTIEAQQHLELLQMVRVADFVIGLQSFEAGIEYAHDQGIISPAYTVLRPRNAASTGYLRWLLKSAGFIDEIALHATGIRQGQSVAYESLGRSVLPQPPLDEQAAIARFLDHTVLRIRRYVAAKKKLIALLNEQRQAIVNRAVTRGLDPFASTRPSGVEWLGDMPAHWEVRGFTRCAVEIADYRGATPTKTESGVFLVTARNVRRGWIDYEASMEFVAAKDYATIMRRGLPRIGDLLLTMEAPLGNAALVDREDVALAQRVVRFRFASDRLVPRFALLSVLSAYFQNQLLRRGTGSTAVGIKASKLPQLRLLCPPLTEQAAIVSQIDDACAPLTHGIERTRREIDLLREYGVRLVADVVTGKLDVRAAASQLPDEVEEPEPLDGIDALAEADVSEDEADLDGAAREVEV